MTSFSYLLSELHHARTITPSPLNISAMGNMYTPIFRILFLSQNLSFLNRDDVLIAMASDRPYSKRPVATVSKVKYQLSHHAAYVVRTATRTPAGAHHQIRQNGVTRAS